MLARWGWIVLSVLVVAGCRGAGEPRVVAGPSADVAARVHLVRAGETFYGIARVHGTDVGILEFLNPGVEPRKLRVGQTLRLPAVDEEPRPKPLLRAIRNVDDGVGGGR